MSADYQQLTEGARTLIIDYITQNIGANLTTVAQSVGYPEMTLENPVEYFVYPKPHGYRPPCVFVLAQGTDFRTRDIKANMINALDTFKVVLLAEDQDADTLTYKVDRYASALHMTLSLADIYSTNNKLHIKIVVKSLEYSDIYQRTKDNETGGNFCKSVVLTCDVEHYEGF